jgi:hypothetical protein
VIPIPALGCALSASFAISFVLCVLGFYTAPSLPVVHGALAVPLPGFEFGSWPRFFLGLAESVAWGWYIALVFGTLYNFFVVRFRSSSNGD